jgi:hypothetical protein
VLLKCQSSVRSAYRLTILLPEMKTLGAVRLGCGVKAILTRDDYRMSHVQARNRSP